MAKVSRVKKVTRVQNKTLAGTVYYPRIEFSGADLEVIGYKYGDRVRITIDTETNVITIEKVQ